MNKKNIVILSLDALGDATLRQPLFSALLDAGHRVTVVARRGYHRLLAYLDPRLGVIATDVNPYLPPGDGARDQMEELRGRIAEQEPDLLVSAPYNRTWADEWMMRLFPDLDRLGFDNPSLPGSLLDNLRPGRQKPPFPSGTVLSQALTCPEDSPETLKNRLLLQGISGVELTPYEPRILLPEELERRARQILGELGLDPGHYAIGCPAGTVNVPLKTWPAEEFRDLAVHLRRKHQMTVLATGVPSEAAVLNEMAQAAASCGARVIVRINDDLPVLLGLIRNSRLYLGNDTGPMHFAAALGVPVVARFGGGHWPRFLPAARRHFVATQKLPCFACNWACWLDEPRCMTMIPAETFAAGLDWVLESDAREGKIDLGKRIDPFMEKIIGRAKTVISLGSQKLTESELDRAARLDQACRLTGLLREAEADRAERLEQINRLSRILKEAEADRAQRLEQVNRLSRLLNEAEADRAQRLEQVNRLSQLLKEAEADRVERLEQINRLSRLLNEAEADRAARLKQIHELTRRTQDSEIGLASLRAEAAGLIDQLREAEAERAVQRELINRLARVQELVGRLYGPRAKGFLRRLGLLGWVEGKIFAAPPARKPPGGKGGPPGRGRRGGEKKISCVAVDVTPLLPGVENGGAKLLVLELVSSLAKLLPDCQFVLLTSDCSHEELARWDSPNVRRLCLEHRKAASAPSAALPRPARARVRLREWLAAALPAPLLVRMKTAYRSMRSLRAGKSGVLRELGADLLFCPFTMPFYHDPAVPTVSIVFDLQYHYYPQFFQNEDRAAREYHFKETCRLADRLVCISEYVRGTVLENSNLPPEHVVSIPIRLLRRLKQPAPEAVSSALGKHGLDPEGFLLYPANFWPHKNHPMLFTAFSMFRHRHPRSNLRLVCTGSPDSRMEALREAAWRMGLESRVYFPGFLPDEEFSCLLASCRALIFPSLYEGFGMPVLEAMAFGRPVLCSNVTSLPEVARDAALLFDPRKPQEILAAIEGILQDSDLSSRLAARGYQRAAAWGDEEQMARAYFRVFQDALNGERRIPSGLHGVYSDGWTQERVIVGYEACPETRHLEMVFELPPVHPNKRLSIRVTDDQSPPRTYHLARGDRMSFRHPLSEKGGAVEFRFEPAFQPRECGLNEDQRWLGCLVRDCAILRGNHRENLLGKAPP